MKHKKKKEDNNQEVLKAIYELEVHLLILEGLVRKSIYSDDLAQVAYQKWKAARIGAGLELTAGEGFPAFLAGFKHGLIKRNTDTAS